MSTPLKSLLACLVLGITAMQVHADTYQFHHRVKGIAPAAVWQPYDSLVGEWANVGGVYGCTNWSPDPATVDAGTLFTQTATDCKQAQERVIQDRERDAVSGAIRNTGESTTESQVVTASSSREATGTKTAPTCLYSTNSPMSYWVFHNTTSSVYRSPYYNGVQLPVKMTGGNGGNQWTQFTVNGVTYYRGTYVRRDGDYRYYSICR